jgi:3-phenylpropionate/trans-cinnamate dioxygenase ferredoxin subunit
LSEVDWLTFVRVASVKELKAGEMKPVEAGGMEILLVNLGGEFYAIGNRCTHMSCLLSDGKIEGENVRCWCHGSVFNVKTGGVFEGSARKPEPVFQVRVEGGQVFVDV